MGEISWTSYCNILSFVSRLIIIFKRPQLLSFVDDPIQCQHMSSPLGNGAVVETSDKKIVVLRRSSNVGEFPGHFVFPGGHPEVQENETLAFILLVMINGSDLICDACFLLDMMILGASYHSFTY